MEKLERITMDTMEFDGAKALDRGRGEGEEDNLLIASPEEEGEQETEEAKGVFSSIRKVLKALFATKRDAKEEEYTDHEEDEEEEMLTVAEDEGIKDGGEKQKKKFPVSFPWRSISLKNGILIGCLALIAVAGYVNVRYYTDTQAPADISSGSEQQNNNDGEKDKTDAPPAPSQSTSSEESTGDDYFSVAVISRQRSRDESIELLMTMLESEATTPERRDEISQEMARIADEMSYEVNIENLIKAKGIEECVAVINNGNANIVVKYDGLTPSHIAQIKEIVYLNANILPKNIKIIEKS